MLGPLDTTKINSYRRLRICWSVGDNTYELIQAFKYFLVRTEREWGIKREREREREIEREASTERYIAIERD